VRLCAPLPDPARVGTDDALAADGEWRFECKLAAIIGCRAANVPAGHARSHIAGYALMLALGSGVSALGPWIVTSDEAGDPYALPVRLRVNGHEKATTNSASVAGTFESRLERLSAVRPVLPGEVLASTLDVDVATNPGDRIELEIDKLGALRTTVA
jgi:2-keto-4-pentenoate hydratase/2-oxohepta-3-ene-1,7-dioic acid hydratase in catechol pathway